VSAKQTYLLHKTAKTIKYNMAERTSCCHVTRMAGTRLVPRVRILVTSLFGDVVVAVVVVACLSSVMVSLQAHVK